MIKKILYNNQVWRVFVNKPYRGNNQLEVIISEKKSVTWNRKGWDWINHGTIYRRDDKSYVLNVWQRNSMGKMENHIVDLNEDWSNLSEYFNYYGIRYKFAEFKQQYEAIAVTMRLMECK
jgi:hypothetical protein